MRSNNLKRLGKEFLTSTSMHGLKYIGEDNRHIFERILWIFMFAFGLMFSTYLCWGMVNKFYSSPAVMSIESTDKRLADFPFPSITICSQNKISKKKMSRILANPRYSQHFTKEQIMTLTLTMINALESINYADELKTISKIASASNISFKEILNVTSEVMVTCDDLFLDCQWLNLPTPCSELFEQIPTDDGLCCGFNPIESGWKFGSDVVKMNTIKTVHLPGYRIGLTVAIDANLEDYAASTGRSNGFKVLLHHPPEYPEVGERGFLVSPGFELCSGLNPMSSYNTPDVDALALHQRGCYMDSENILKFYSNYSVTRCMVECLTRQLIEKCSCRPYYYKAKPFDRVCELEDYICLSTVFESFRESVVFDKCNQCYPKCNDVWYFNDVSMAPFPGELFHESRTFDRIMEAKNTSMSRNQFREYLRENVALLNVFYKEMTGYVYRNDVRYGKDDFISAIGGLLGLGFGFSFISAMELIYFFSIRMYFTNKDESKNVIYPENSINSPIIPGGEKIISANNVAKRGKITNSSFRRTIANGKSANIPLK